MRILVTGGAGFIGSHVVDALVAKGHTVSVIDNLSTGSVENLPKGVTLFHRSITEDLNPVFEKAKPEVIFHLAAQVDVQKSNENPKWDAEQNVIGALNILEACRTHGCKRVIFSSSGGALYGDGVTLPTTEETRTWPESPYGISKLSIELYLDFYRRVHDFSVCSLRYANVYGPRQSLKGEAGVVAIFTRKLIRKEQPKIFGDGTQTRDYVYVKDVVAANMVAFEDRIVGTFNIGTGVETSVNELYRMISSSLDYPWKAQHTNVALAEIKRSALSSQKIAAHWKPHYTLEKGLAETITWFKQHETGAAKSETTQNK